VIRTTVGRSGLVAGGRGTSRVLNPGILQGLDAGGGSGAAVEFGHDAVGRSGAAVEQGDDAVG
jgi:hypothetical protein